MRRRLGTIATVLLLIAGLSLLLYPAVSNYIISLGHKQTIAEYKSATETIPDNTYEELLEEAVKYNEWLAGRGTYLRDLKSEELEEYYMVLDPFDTGVMGYIVIPDINVSLPVYHGIDDTVLQAGVGHLPGTSLPVGGEGTHAILSAHTGLVSAKLFTDISQLEKGDIFLLHVLNETLAYEVDDIKVILPEELGLTEIKEGKDWVTLLTCTPYGVNTHRLLVRGTRTEVPENAEDMQEIAEDVPAPDATLFIALAVFIILISIVSIRKKHKKRKNKTPIKGVSISGKTKKKPKKETAISVDELKQSVRLSTRHSDNDGKQ